MTDRPDAQVSRVALKAFWRVCERWHLDDVCAARILGVDATKAELTKAEPFDTATPDMLVRISQILGIYSALHQLLPAVQADQWVHARNTAPMYRGDAAIERIAGGTLDDLRAVREYLEAQLH